MCCYCWLPSVISGVSVNQFMAFDDMCGGISLEEQSKSNHMCTHGSGECIGEEECRIYWVHWNTRNAKLARKSLAESRPATGRSMNPVCSVCVEIKRINSEVDELFLQVFK